MMMMIIIIYSKLTNLEPGGTYRPQHNRLGTYTINSAADDGETGIVLSEYL